MACLWNASGRTSSCSRACSSGRCTRGSSTPPTSCSRRCWKRKLLAYTLADAFKTLGRAKRDVARERSLEAALDQSSERLQAWLAAEQSSPSEQADRNEQAA